MDRPLQQTAAYWREACLKADDEITRLRALVGEALQMGTTPQFEGVCDLKCVNCVCGYKPWMDRYEAWSVRAAEALK